MSTNVCRSFIVSSGIWLALLGPSAGSGPTALHTPYMNTIHTLVSQPCCHIRALQRNAYNICISPPLKSVFYFKASLKSIRVKSSHRPRKEPRKKLLETAVLLKAILTIQSDTRIGPNYLSSYINQYPPVKTSKKKSKNPNGSRKSSGSREGGCQ